MTNSINGAEAMVRMLEAHGVRHIFGLCGDTTLPLYDAMHQLKHDITHVLTRDERSATYMADAYSRVSGRPGVAEGPSGGGSHLSSSRSHRSHRKLLCGSWHHHRYLSRFLWEGPANGG